MIIIVLHSPFALRVMAVLRTTSVDKTYLIMVMYKFITSRKLLRVYVKVSKAACSLQVYIKFRVCLFVSHVAHACYMYRPSYQHLYDNSNNIR
jgi:hypothetical protein